MTAPEGHLGPEEIESLHGLLEEEETGPFSDAATEQARRHVVSCPSCRERLRAHGETERRLGSLRAADDTTPGASCPPAADWERVAAGTLPPSRAEELLEHSTTCDACSALLRRASELLSPDVSDEEDARIASLPTTSESVQKELSTRLAELSNRGAPPSATKEPRRPGGAFLTSRFAAAAAIVAISIVGAWLLRESLSPSVDELLAEAYGESRTMELRIAGAHHAPMKQERGNPGPALSKPASLLRAEYLIKERLTEEPDNAALLGEKGRAELLEWSYNEAIRTFELALEIEPDSPELLRDLATAHFQRAEVEGRPTDYGLSLEYLGRSLALNPSDPVAVFNRAIVAEKLFLYREAIADWERYLRLDPEGEWAREAKERLEEIRRRMERSDPEGPREEPEAAVPKLGNGSTVLARRGTSLGIEDDLDTAILHGLPALEDGGPIDTDAPEWRALTELAEVLSSEHGDAWLNDVLSEAAAPGVVSGLTLLGEAVAHNARGDFEDAATRAVRAIRTFDQSGCRACSLRARWEQAYALQRAQRGQDCLNVAQTELQSAPASYPWVRAQLLLESSVCALMVGESSTARSRALRALDVSEAAAYPNLTLRALHFTGNALGRDDPDTAWTYYREGLRRHWDGEYSPFRVYQFYAEMGYWPEADSLWYLATALAREAVAHIARTPNKLVEAMARHALAVNAQFAGDTAEAEQELVTAGELLASLPPTAVTRTFGFSAEAYRALLEVRNGHPDRALRRLHRIRTATPSAATVTQYWVWLTYYQALGEAEAQRGSVDSAESALETALHISEAILATLSSDADRTAWAERTDSIYRSLVDLELTARGDATPALEVLEWYRGVAERRAGPALDFDELPSERPLPDPRLVQSRLPSLRHETVLTLAELPSGLHAWVFDDRGVHLRTLGATGDGLDHLATRFARLCRDPSSSLEALRSTGRQLYDRLIVPLVDALDPDRTLRIEAEGPLGTVPFEALVLPDGRYFGERFRIAYSLGLDSETGRRPWGRLLPTERALVVAATGASQLDGRVLPPLPQARAEALKVASLFANPVVLLGEEATRDAVEREIPGVGVIHFAGHALAGSERNGLVLMRSAASADPSPALLEGSAIGELDLKSTRLVVLSACSTAVGPTLRDPRNLVRAFLHGGVERVVASRWNVDSASTERIVERFYDRLKGSDTPAEALRTAVGEVRGDVATGHPYYWAAFSVYGRS